MDWIGHYIPLEFSSFRSIVGYSSSLGPIGGYGGKPLGA
jgi:hypothetical protein